MNIEQLRTILWLSLIISFLRNMLDVANREISIFWISFTISLLILIVSYIDEISKKLFYLYLSFVLAIQYLMIYYIYYFTAHDHIYSLIILMVLVIISIAFLLYLKLYSKL